MTLHNFPNIFDKAKVVSVLPVPVGPRKNELKLTKLIIWKLI